MKTLMKPSNGELKLIMLYFPYGPISSLPSLLNFARYANNSSPRSMYVKTRISIRIEMLETSFIVLVKAESSCWNSFQNLASLKSLIKRKTLKAVIAPLPVEVYLTVYSRVMSATLNMTIVESNQL